MRPVRKPVSIAIRRLVSARDESAYEVAAKGGSQRPALNRGLTIENMNAALRRQGSRVVAYADFDLAGGDEPAAFDALLAYRQPTRLGGPPRGWPAKSG